VPPPVVVHVHNKLLLAACLACCTDDGHYTNCELSLGAQGLEVGRSLTLQKCISKRQNLHARPCTITCVSSGSSSGSNSSECSRHYRSLRGWERPLMCNTHV
jgi:hypothetical protein